MRYLFASNDERRRMDLKKSWRRVDGDRTLRLHYPLNRDSVVVDVGGYHGQWSSDIHSLYKCRVHIFEPIPKFAEIIARRFLSNRNITLHRIALGTHDGETAFKDANDSTGRHAISDLRGSETTVRVRAAAAYFTEHNIDNISLMKINIEGDEYDLLDHLGVSGVLANIDHLQIQFHSFVPDADQRMAHAHTLLEKTHSPSYQYRYIWEGWKRK